MQYVMRHNRRKTIDSVTFTGNQLPVNVTEGQASEAERGRYKPADLFLLERRYFNGSKCSLFLNWNSPFHAEPKH